MDPEYTGSLISNLRKEKGWTQKEIAEKLYVSVAAVSKWERGLNYPDLSLMEPLAELLGISVSKLLGLEHEQPDQVIRSVTEISASERGAAAKRNRRRLGLLIVTIAVFLVLAYITLVVGRKDKLLLELFQLSGGSLGCDLLAISLGLAAWALALGAIFAPRGGIRWKSYTILSFACCGAALYIPTLITDLVIRFGYYATLEDTIWGYHFASIVLLLGTVLGNLCAWRIHREKGKST